MKTTILLFALMGLAIAAPADSKVGVRSEVPKTTVREEPSKTSVRSEVSKTNPVQEKEEQVRGFEPEPQVKEVEQVKDVEQRIETTTAARIEQNKIEQTRDEEPATPAVKPATPVLPAGVNLQNFMILVPLEHFHNIINLNNVGTRMMTHPESVRNAFVAAGRSYSDIGSGFGTQAAGASAVAGNTISGSTTFGQSFGQTFGSGFGGAVLPVGGLVATPDQTSQVRIDEPHVQPQAQAAFSIAQPLIGLRSFLPSFLMSAQVPAKA